MEEVRLWTGTLSVIFAFYAPANRGTRLAIWLAVLQSLVCPTCESPNVTVLRLQCDDCGEVTVREHGEPYARPKRDRRREPRNRQAPPLTGQEPPSPARAVAAPVPLFTPVGAVLLDVTLRRGAEVRRWTISSDGPDGWSCRLVTTTSVTVSRCGTGEAVATKEREWRAEVEAARAAGWT